MQALGNSFIWHSLGHNYSRTKCMQFLCLFARKTKPTDRKCCIVIYENYTQLFSLFSIVGTKLDLYTFGKKRALCLPFGVNKAVKYKMEYKVEIKRLEFWLWVRPQRSYRMNNLSTCNIVCAAEGGNFPLVLLNKWRSFPWPQMLFSECHIGLICILTVVILTKNDR